MLPPKLLPVVSLLLAGLLQSACDAQESPSIIHLRDYLAEMSERLDCYFTFEDLPVPGTTNTYPWIADIKGFVPDLEITTIDALVAKLDQELEGVTVVRSTSYPSVVHLIAEALLQQGYVLEQAVTIEHSGSLGSLLDQLEMLTDGKIGRRTGGAIRPIVRFDDTTEVEVSVQNQTVRNVLTGAVPLQGYGRFLWESRRVEISGNPKIVVRYYGPPPKPEDFIVTLGDYLLYMGDKLNCYFTFEDRFDPEDGEFSWIVDLRNSLDEIEFDLELATIDALVAKLDEDFSDVKVVRSTQYPSVVHLIKEQLLQPGYVIEDAVTVQYEGALGWLPEKLGTLLDERIDAATGSDTGSFPVSVGGDYETVVQVNVENQKVRDVLTGAVPLVPDRRFLWQAGRFNVNEASHVLVEFHDIPVEVPP